MRFMTLVKSCESNCRPSQAFMEEMAKHNQEASKAGKLIETGGLFPSAHGASVRLARGTVTVTDGPFAETKEVLGGYAVLDVKSKAEAIESATWLLQLFLKYMPDWEGEIEVRQMFGPQDMPACDHRGLKKEDLVFSRVFDAPVERVWRAWTDPEQVMRWWGPDHFTCPLARIDLREGGTSLVCMRAPKEFGGQDMYSTWTYTKIVPLRRIEYLHHFADKHGNRVHPSAQGLPPDMPEEVRNAVSFEAAGERRTKIVVTEYDWPAGQMKEMSRLGMEQCLDKMAATFAAHQAPCNER
jgi:uncharacterized protein YndB with AHSA1/START domain